MSTDRLSDGYQPDWDIDMEYGAQGVLFVHDIIRRLADGSTTIEVKRDGKAAVTGNLYVEYECKSRPSGIATTQASLYAYVISDDIVIVAPTERWKDAARGLYMSGRVVACDRGSHPTRGVKIKLSELLRRLMGETGLD